MFECIICGAEVLADTPSGNIVCASCLPTSSTPGKPLQDVVKDMSDKILRTVPEKSKDISPGKMVKVFSRQYKGKSHSVSGQFDLIFDEYGHADVPVHRMPVLQQEMKHRPGRISVVKAAPPPLPVAVEEEIEFDIIVVDDDDDDEIMDNPVVFVGYHVEEVIVPQMAPRELEVVPVVVEKSSPRKNKSNKKKKSKN